MADPVAEAGKPVSRPAHDNGEPLWAQIVSLFARRGLETPSTKLRDELVSHLAWARWAVDRAEPEIARLSSELAAERERNARLVAALDDLLKLIDAPGYILREAKIIERIGLGEIVEARRIAQESKP